ncbi:unnamed protein product [Cunninghamella echinulata]
MWILSLYILISTCLLVTANCPCGKRIGPRKFIVNGNHVMNPTKYPWMAQISFYKNGRKVSSCTGSIIRSQWVITAGHCVEDRSMQIIVYVGDVSIQNVPTGGYRVVQTLRHPNYMAQQTLHYDVALLRLDRPITYSATVQPICLPSSTLFSYPSAFTTAGWGFLRHEGPPASILQETQLTENLNCYSQGGNQQTQICAQIRGGRSTCYGDGGGPLMYEMHGSITLVGLTSGIIGPYRCGTEGANIYFARVSTFVNWIQQIIGNQC